MDRVDEWAGYQFDMAALTIGRKVENALSKNAMAKKNRKPEAQILADILGAGAGEKREFASLSKKVAVKTVKPGGEDYEILSNRSKSG